MKLMTPADYSHKTELGLKAGVGEAILYLAPRTEAFVDEDGDYLPEYVGRTMCPGASPECFRNCLIHSGQMIMPHARRARVRRTRLLIDDPQTFGRLLVQDVHTHLRWAVKRDLAPAFRFNGTSDWAWETWDVPHLGATIHEYLARVSPEAQVSEYTKRYAVMQRWLEGAYNPNVYMTFSLHEQNELQARRILESGGNVAVVFRTKKGQPLPPSWFDRPVLDGDGDDLRWLDGHRALALGLGAGSGLVIGLRAKGRLARTVSPFSVDPTIRRQPVSLPLLRRAA